MAGKHGGKREGSGRKPRAEEIKLIERLSPLADTAFRELKKGVESGDFRFIKLFLEYYAGKPKETKDITTNGESITFGSIQFFDSEQGDQDK